MTSSKGILTQRTPTPFISQVVVGLPPVSGRVYVGFMCRYMSGLARRSCRVLVGFMSGSCRVYVGFMSGSGRVYVGFMSGFGRVLKKFNVGFTSGCVLPVTRIHSTY